MVTTIRRLHWASDAVYDEARSLWLLVAPAFHFAAHSKLADIDR